MLNARMCWSDLFCDVLLANSLFTRFRQSFDSENCSTTGRTEIWTALNIRLRIFSVKNQTTLNELAEIEASKLYCDKNSAYTIEVYVAHYG